MSAKNVQLSEVCEIIAGQSPPSSTYNSDGVGLPFFQGKADFGEIYPTVRYWCSSPNKIAKPDDILLSVRAPVGDTNICNQESCIGRGLAAIRTGKNLDNKFLLHFLRQHAPRLVAKSNGSTFQAITMKDVREIELPLPPLPEQKRIAAILDKAEEIKRKREESLKLADEFLKSVFVDMFGDPFANPKHWKTVNLGEIILEGPQNGLYKPSSCYGKGNPIIRIDSFYNGIVDISALKYVEVSEKELSAFEVFQGDFVINRVNSRSHLGKCGLIPELKERTVFESNMMRIKFNSEQIDNEYALMILTTEYMKNQILNSAKDAVNQSSINQKDVSSFIIPLPSLAEQKRFAEIVRRVRKQRQAQENHLNSATDLFGSLTQKAFQGQL